MKPRTKQILVSFVMGMLVGIVVALTMRPTPVPTVAYVQVPPTQTTAVVNKAYTAPMATPEDTPGWDCKNSGNHICGPGNPQKAKPGLYNHNRRVVTWDDLKAWGIVH
jgi:xanthosine utilization system XapX-like protein